MDQQPLEQLVDWGNLQSQPDTAPVATIDLVTRSSKIAELLIQLQPLERALLQLAAERDARLDAWRDRWAGIAVLPKLRKQGVLPTRRPAARYNERGQRRGSA